MTGSQILARAADRSWMADAACRTHDPEMWFPRAGLPDRLALIICGYCPVRERCADYAEEIHERNGVWGGRTFGERSRRARQREAK
jgi:WhiB family redox-sensing transcriptional regulator